MTSNPWWQGIWNQPLLRAGWASVAHRNLSGRTGKRLCESDAILTVNFRFPWSASKPFSSYLPCETGGQTGFENQKIQPLPPRLLDCQDKQKKNIPLLPFLASFLPTSLLPIFGDMSGCGMSRWEDVDHEIPNTKLVCVPWIKTPPLRSHLDDIPAMFTLLAVIVSLQIQAIHLSQVDPLTSDNSYKSICNV